jgi:BTB/POZ domain
MKLNLRGKLFDTSKDVLVKAGSTYFSLLLSSPLFELDCDGVYFIDRTSVGFGRILDYMNTGVLSLEGLNKYDVDCIYDNLDYFKIPHTAQIDCSRGSSVEGLRMDVLLQLRDGRLCGRTNDSDIHIWSMDTNMIEITLKGHTGNVHEIIEHADGRLSIQSFHEGSAIVSNSQTYQIRYDKVSGETSDKLTTYFYPHPDCPLVLLFIVCIFIPVFFILFFWPTTLFLSDHLCPGNPDKLEIHERIGLCMDSYLSRWIVRG